MTSKDPRTDNKGITRRGFLRQALVAGTGLIGSTALNCTTARAQAPSPGLANDTTSVQQTSVSETKYQSGPDRRPNILFLFTDDQRFDAFGAADNSEVATPHMDRLTEAGTCFTNASIMGSTCPAVCMPSRAMLMSGRTLFRAPGDLADTITFPELMRRAGYTTFATGKWHNQRPSFARSFSTGAKIFFGGMSNHLEVPVYDFDPSGEYPADEEYIGQQFSTELFSDVAIEFLEQYDDDNPFLAYVSYTAPHDPRMAPDKYQNMYPPQRIPVPDNFMPEHPFDNGELRIRDEKLAPWPRTPAIIQQHIADYYAMITHLDAHIGRILQVLEETGHADNTIIIWAGDNGLAVGQHGLMGKQNMYEHSVRVPLVIAGPGIPKGRRIDSFCYLLDLFPTLCSLTDLPIPDSVEGKDLTSIIKGENQSLRDNLYFAYRDVQRAVRDKRYKLVEYTVDGSRHTQLFDLVRDPAEVNNLATDPDYDDEVARLRDELVTWQKRLSDPMTGYNWCG